MSHYTTLWYHAEHETNSKKQTTRRTSETGSDVVAARQRPERGSAPGGSDAAQCSSLAGCDIPRFCQTQATQARTWSPQLLIGKASETIGKSASTWSACTWLCRRLLDTGANRTFDLEVIWGTLSSQFCLASAATHGLELPEATACGLSTRRRGHCPLEALHLAKDKKSGASWGRHSYLKMRAANRWCARSNAPGPRGGKHPKPAPAFNIGNASTLWGHCSSPPKDARSGCAPRPISGRSRVNKLLLSCAICCRPYAARLCWCGIRHRFINAKKCRHFWLNIRVFTFILFLPTRRNSIRSSLFGRKPMNIWQAKLLRISSNWWHWYAPLCIALVDRSLGCGHAFMLQSCLGSIEGCDINFTKFNS